MTRNRKPYTEITSLEELNKLSPQTRIGDKNFAVFLRTGAPDGFPDQAWWGLDGEYHSSVDIAKNFPVIILENGKD